jgi:hypothetical protein
LIYPIIPKVAITIGDEIKLKFDEFPNPKGKTNVKLLGRLMEFNRMVWKKKKDLGISLRSEIKEIKIPKELKAFEKDLRATHNLV